MNAIEELRDYAQDNRVYPCFATIQGLLDRIEQEYIELPKDKNGKHIRLGDIVSFGNGKGNKEKKVLFIQIHDGGRTCVATTTFMGFSSLVEIIEHDSQEKIDADSLLPASEYCFKYKLSHNSIQEQVQDLLRRQRELLERK